MTTENDDVTPTEDQFRAMTNMINSVRDLNSVWELNAHYADRVENDPIRIRANILLDIIEDGFVIHFDRAMKALETTAEGPR